MRTRRRIVWGLLVFALIGMMGTIGGYYAAGYRGYVIHTGSMEPTLMPGDLIIDRPADGTYRAGEVITFRHGPTPDLVTHRIVDVTPAGIHTKGDANRTADVWTIPQPYVEGAVRWVLPGAAYPVIFLRQPTGLASIAVVLIGLVLLWRLFFGAEEGTEEGTAIQPAPPGRDGPGPDGGSADHAIAGPGMGDSQRPDADGSATGPGSPGPLPAPIGAGRHARTD